MNGKQLIEKGKSLCNRLMAEEKKTGLILLIGLLGMLLIFLSGTGEKEDPPQNAMAVSDVSQENEDYCQKTQQKILDLVSSIRGVGEVQVWVTLESGAEYLYLQEETRSRDSSRDVDAQGASITRERDDTEKSYLLIDRGGEEQPLLQKQIEPTIQGVVVVCQGAQDPQVTEQVVGAVSCALGIGSNRVYVAQMRAPLS